MHRPAALRSLDKRLLPRFLSGVAILACAALAVGDAASEGIQQWEANGPTGGTVAALETGPDSTVYAGTVSGGVFRSTNGGKSWHRRSNGLPPDTFVLRIERAPSDPHTLYLQRNNSNVLYATHDGGATWSLLPPVASSIRDLDVHPTQPLTLYLATFDGLWRSADGGETWTTLGGQIYQADAVALASSEPNLAYAHGAYGVYRTTDGGETWSLRSPGSHGRYEVLTVDPTDADTVYRSIPGLGLHKSTDGALTWNLIRPTGFFSVNALAIDPEASDSLYIAVEGDGVFRSTDGGVNWTPISDGLPRSWIRDLALDLEDGLRAYVGFEDKGVFTSANGGESWGPTNHGVVASTIRTLAVDPFSPSTTYAGAYADGLWKTTDSGRRWSRVGLPARNVFGISIPTSRVMYVAADNHVYRRRETGLSWVRTFTIEDRSVVAVAAAPSEPNVVYAATFEGGTFRSVDFGRTWNQIDLTPRVTSFAFHPQNADNVWAGTATDTVYRSTDGGETWTRGVGFTSWGEITAILVDPSNPAILYAAASQGRIYKSVNGGANWAVASNGIQVQMWIMGLTLDSNDPATLYAGGVLDNPLDGHVYKSIDGASTWTEITGDMTTPWTLSLALSPTSTVLFAGTNGGGVFTTGVK